MDTNVLVSSLKSRRGASFKVLSLVGSGLFELNISVPLLLEYEDVLLRKRDSLVFTQVEIEQLLNYLCSQANHHQVYFLWRPILKDPKDDMILELAVKSSSKYIITYNTNDFDGAERFDIKVATAAEFLRLEGFI